MLCLHTVLFHDEVVDYIAVVWKTCSRSILYAAVYV